MKARWKILIAVGVALGVAILILVIRHYQLRFTVANYVAELKAKGEPMDLAQVIPPPVPLEQNGVPFIKNVLTNLPRSSVVWTNPPKAMHTILPGKAEIGWQRSNIIELRGLGIPDDTNTWEDLGRELAAAKSDLDSFQNLTNHPI